MIQLVRLDKTRIRFSNGVLCAKSRRDSEKEVREGAPVCAAGCKHTERGMRVYGGKKILIGRRTTENAEH